MPLPPHPPIVLASTSPRRRELLTAVLGAPEGIGFTVVSPGLDDADLSMGGVGTLGGRSGLRQWVASLAYLKARAGAEVFARAGGGRDCVVIGADTLVDQDGHILSKPAHAGDAARMIRMVRGRSHEVLTGVALLHPASGARDVYADRAVVHVGDITDAEIDAYVAGGTWQGKSGGYNLQERLDAGWPLRAEGDPGCVTGLPTRSLLPRLAAFIESLRKGAAA